MRSFKTILAVFLSLLAVNIVLGAEAEISAHTPDMADALATAWVAMGSTRGLTMIESRHDVEGLIYVDGQRLPVESSGIGSWIVGDPSGPVGWTDVGAD